MKPGAKRAASLCKSGFAGGVNAWAIWLCQVSASDRKTDDLAAGHVYKGPDEPGPAMSDIPEEIEVGTAEMTAAVVEAVAGSEAR